MHRRHHSVKTAARRFAFAALLPLLAACGTSDWPGSSQVSVPNDWDDVALRLSEPGPLGALIDRKPSPVAIRASGPYPGVLNEPVPVLITADIADRVVAEPLRPALSAEARLSLAAASMTAAAAATGAAVRWEGVDASGAVLPARDVYLSHHGRICRDLQQFVQQGNRRKAEQVTLCREDLGDNRILWLPGSPD